MSPTRAKHVEAAYENEAIETLLISDELFRWTTPSQLTTPLPLHYHLIYMTYFYIFLSIYYSFTFFFLSLFSFLLSFFYFSFSSFFLFSFFSLSFFFFLFLSLFLPCTHAHTHPQTDRAKDIAARKRFVRLVDGVRDNGGNVRIFSSMHVSGERQRTFFLFLFFFCFLF